MPGTDTYSTRPRVRWRIAQQSLVFPVYPTPPDLRTPKDDRERHGRRAHEPIRTAHQPRGPRRLFCMCTSLDRARRDRRPVLPRHHHGAIPARLCLYHRLP